MCDNYTSLSPFSFLIMCYVDPGVVRDLMIKTISTNSMLVQWSPPPCPNGPVTGYYIYYHLGSMPQSGNISSDGYRSVQSVSPRAVINDLEPTSVYLVHVRAFYIDNSITFLGEADTESVHRLDRLWTQVRDHVVDTSDDTVQSPESVTSSSVVVQLPSVSSFGSGQLA